MVKTCTKCKEEKDITEFHVSNRNPDGLRFHCKECRKSENARTNSRRRDISRNKYPTPHDICTYAIKEGDEIVYIGSTEYGPYRLWEHFNDKKKTFCREESPLVKRLKYTWHIVWHGGTYDDAKHQEKVLIQIHQPKFNIIKYKSYAA